MTSIDANRLRDARLSELAGKGWPAETFAWCAAFAVAGIVLVLVEFTSQDPDSMAYAQISARLVDLPVRRWIAPEWWGLSGNEGLFREHPVGVFLLPAMLGKLGVPPLQAAFVVGAGFSIAALVLLQRVSALVVSKEFSAFVPWVALILPVAFINRIRATQEYPVLVFLLLAVYATERSRASSAWIAVSLLAACAVALVKGIFVVFVPVVCGLWLLCVRGGGFANRRAWLGIGAAALAVVVGTMAYEGMYRRATGESFLDYYLTYRLNQVATVDRPAAALVADKLQNLGWYSGRLLWFGFPGTLALLVAAATRRRVDDRRVAAGREVQGLYFALSAAAAYVVVMSLGTTRAERFILPAYFSLGIAGALVAVRRWDAVARLADRLARLGPQAPAVAWLLLLLAALPFELYVPYVKYRP